MRENYILGTSVEGFHKIYYREYGQKNHHNTIIAVHGLTRNSSDFHYLATALEDKYHIVAPDVVGRGQSDYLKDPRHYTYAQYICDMTVLLAHTGCDKVTWLGTSMGGIFGMVMASMPNSPIKQLILNDVGPVVPKTAVDRIKAYAGIKLSFESREQAEMILRELYKPFGIKSEEHWHYVFDNSLKEEPDGSLTLAYDSRATAAIQDTQENAHALSHVDDTGNVVFWPYWDNIKCPVLVINGAESDILTPAIIDQMQQRGPAFDHALIPNVGHAPMLSENDQIKVVRAWLDK